MNAPKKSLGQHFLINTKALTMVAESLMIRDGDTVIEIGPGHGELTDLLAASPAAKIIAIEKDHELANALRAKYDPPAGGRNSKIEIVEGDALKDLARVAERIGSPYVLAGNIPYYITGHLLRIAGELQNKPIRTVLTMQKEVALRICAIPPRMNRLAACVQAWGTPRTLTTLAPTDFDPAPTVDSAIIAIETKAGDSAEALPENYYEIVRIVFQQPRKTILNNLASGLSLGKETALDLLKKAGLSGTERPENLSIATIREIARLSTH